MPSPVRKNTMENGDHEEQRLKADHALANIDVNVLHAHRTDVIGSVRVRSRVRSDKTAPPLEEKKPNLTVAEAAAKISVSDLKAQLIAVSALEEEDMLKKFADYFRRAFSAVTYAQFPWVEIFKSQLSNIADIPILHISEDVYKTSIDWINERSVPSLAPFLLWSLDQILLGSQQASSESQVAIFVVVAMVLRNQPNALISILPTLRENANYQGQDNLPVIVWMIAQASHGELAVGLYAWAHNTLPLVCGESSNPRSCDLVLQLVERILSMPKARTILVNCNVRRGKRLVPPSAFEMVLSCTFSSAGIEATKRFEAVYPTLKAVALAGQQGSEAMNQVSQEILSFAVKAAGEGTPELSNEGAELFIWCLTQNVECFKLWVSIYEGNLRASVTVLKKLSDQWKKHSANLFPLVPLKETLKRFRHKNKMLKGEVEYVDKYCKSLLGQVSHGNWCKKSVAFVVVALTVGAAAMSPNMKSVNWNI